ncbi:probable inactive receptor kinase at4g23740 [Phtheirospermum japonicum]|uniref:Probable inactive receptor kinase at4g23740 n=1 Tax=Phtheirospermum japonicum TaxID=374723 RepID=A0A830BY42_9LAMI|nr:probable inactive receptor kinase at4g23740 [Phtheirospermum japonicum]
MSAIYDNWERLVDAVLKKQQLWELFHDHSRSPSVLSEASDFSSSFYSRSSLHNLSFDFARLGSSSWSQRGHPKLVLVSDFSPAINVKYLYLASSELLGTGTLGTTYAAAMDNGVRIVVKRLRLMSISEQDFRRHMDTVGDVRHDNVVSLRAYYSSGDERLVLYDYYRKGSVHALLHGRNRKPRPDVDWESRLKIAIGAARGIAEIHKQNGGKLVHGNIRASNVFLNPDQYGCVSELGLRNLIASKSMSDAHYYAPEVKNTQDVSQASDVYSFGVLLLELLTRKSPAHVPGGPKAVNLVKLVTSVINRIRAANVFDADLLKHPTIKEQMVKLFQIGMRCVEKSAIKRPKMSEVVMLLQKITMLSSTSQITQLGKSSWSQRVHPKLVLISDFSPAIDVKCLYLASSEILGIGISGTTYAVTMDNGVRIVVKRLRLISISEQDFKRHMDIVGNVRHENVAALRAYYSSKDERLMLYDYYCKGSVYALLHGRNRKPRADVDWESRLKIAIGAARGIAEIHKHNGGKLVHGNIIASNVFLNRDMYGCISDLGLTNLIATNKSTLTAHCYAPELKNTQNLSQASDVYSFGILLLELLTRKSPAYVPCCPKPVNIVKLVTSVINRIRAANVFDADLLKHPTIKEQMVKMFQIGMRCENRQLRDLRCLK